MPLAFGDTSTRPRGPSEVRYMKADIAERPEMADSVEQLRFSRVRRGYRPFWEMKFFPG